ncbi:MAG TPA: hypothetical protein VGD79_02985 [Thermoanaerobaculia bacterium]
MSRAIRLLVHAALRLEQAKRELALAIECLGRDPGQQKGDAPEMLRFALEQCEKFAKYIEIAANEATFVKLEVMAGLLTGELVPEDPSEYRPRIVLKPRLVAIRAFLASRMPRVVERIAPLLQRRRRTPRPAEIQVPKPSVLGRAPPLFSACRL